MSAGREMDRRRFMLGGIAAALGSTAAVAGAADPSTPPHPEEASWQRYRERNVSSACAQCSAGCGISVRVVEGRAVKIEGLTDDPINAGGIGPRGLSGLEVLYDPDRIRQPMRRRRPGADGLEPVSWDEALGELGTHLSELRIQRRPELLAVLCGRPRGAMRDLLERFAHAFGTPNFFDGAAREGSAVRRASALMRGTDEIPAYDWQSTRYVLSLGADILEASCQGIYFARAAAEIRRGRPGERAKIVQVEPSRSRTALSADEWISIVPGTYAAFALGVAHVLVREGAYDRDFVRDHCFGFEDWDDEDGVRHQGLRHVLRDRYAPATVGRICGIDGSVVERIARELAGQRPAFVLTHDRATRASNGLQTAMAVEALNALLGAVDRPGGILTQRPPPLAPWPSYEIDPIAQAGLGTAALAGGESLGAPPTEGLWSTFAPGSEATPEVLFVYYANPAYAWGRPREWKRALDAIPFVVSFSPFLDETVASSADLVLPDHTYLERWEDAAPTPSVGHPIFGLRRPVVEPVHDTRATGDVVIDLAKRVGGSVADAFPWTSFRSAILRSAAGIQKTQRGSIRAANAKRFVGRLVDEGFWFEAPYPFERWSDVLRTASGKLELASLALRNEVHARGAAAGMPAEAALQWMSAERDLDLFCMPHYEPPRMHGDRDEYPLLLEPYRPGTYAEGSGANLPLLQELVVEPGERPWTTTATLNPETAASLGVGDGDRVVVESPAGRVTVGVALHAGVRPGVLRIPQGGGHTAYGRWARGRGVNVMDLVVADVDPWTGSVALHGTRVNVRRL